jgi:hypothetical protein
MVIDEWVHGRLERRFFRPEPLSGVRKDASAPDPGDVGEPRTRAAVVGFAAAVVLGVADAVTIWAGRLTR